MGIMQLLNLILFWLFFGFLTAHFAQKRGKNPAIWFIIGTFLGIFGLLLLFITSRKVIREEPRIPTLIPAKVLRSDAWIKLWYYLDPTHNQQGPFEFPDFVKNWRSQKFTEKTLIWGEGMAEWKKLSDLPDLLKEMEQI